jgi:hypothetical protein
MSLGTGVLQASLGYPKALRLSSLPMLLVMDSYYTQAMRSQKEKQEDVTAFVLSDLNP